MENIHRFSTNPLVASTGDVPVTEKENEIEATGFPSDMLIQLYWMGRDPIQKVMAHISELVNQRYPDASLLKVACTVPPQYRTELKSEDGSSTATLHSMIVVLELNLHIRDGGREESEIAARLGYFADNLDEPESMTVRYRFALEGDEEY